MWNVYEIDKYPRLLNDPLSNEKNKALEPALEIMFHIPLQNYQDE